MNMDNNQDNESTDTTDEATLTPLQQLQAHFELANPELKAERERLTKELPNIIKPAEEPAPDEPGFLGFLKRRPDIAGTIAAGILAAATGNQLHAGDMMKSYLDSFTAAEDKKKAQQIESWKLRDADLNKQEALDAKMAMVLARAKGPYGDLGNLKSGQIKESLLMKMAAGIPLSNDEKSTMDWIAQAENKNAQMALTAQGAFEKWLTNDMSNMPMLMAPDSADRRAWIMQKRREFDAMLAKPKVGASQSKPSAGANGVIKNAGPVFVPASR